MKSRRSNSENTFFFLVSQKNVFRGPDFAIWCYTGDKLIKKTICAQFYGGEPLQSSTMSTDCTKREQTDVARWTTVWWLSLKNKWDVIWHGSSQKGENMRFVKSTTQASHLLLAFTFPVYFSKLNPSCDFPKYTK